MNSTNRRDFLRSGGTVLGAGVVVTTGLGATAAQAAPTPNAAEDREAIHAVHREYLAGLHRADSDVTYRPRLAAQPDRVAVAADGRTAQAVFHVEAETVTPLQGDSTLVQMARLQGQVANRRVDAGRIAAEYEKQEGQWRIRSLRFDAV